MKTFSLKALSAIIIGTGLIASAASASDIPTGGELSVITKLTDAHVRNFNPYNDAVGLYFAQDFIYEMLWIPNIMHPDNPIPVLATDFEVSDDLASVTYELRQGVEWSDGKPFTADDVVFTVEYAKAHPDYNIRGINWYNEDTGEGSIVGVTKNNDHSVTIHLDEPNGLAYLGLGQMYPLPKHVFESIDDPKNFRNENPVATGPFTSVEHFSPTMVKVCRNENYWQGDKPYIDCIKFPQYSSNEQAQAAASLGEVDWLGVGLTNVKAYTRKSDNNKYWYSAGGNTNLQLNTTKAPFNSLPFRQAMSIAINRQDLHDFATFGLTTPTKYPIGTGEFYASWYNEERLEPYKYLMDYNPELAMELLDEAGIVDQDGDGYRDMPNGDPINFKISVPSGWTDWVNSVMQISENLQDIGVNAKAHTPDENAWFEAVPRGDFDAYIMWTHSNVVPWGTYNDLFNPADMEEGALSFQAMHQMKIPEIMDSLDAFTRTVDRQEQLQHIGDVHELVAQNLPVISLFANPEWYQYNTSRFEGWSNADNPYVRPMVHGGTPERWQHVLNLHLRSDEMAQK